MSLYNMQKVVLTAAFAKPIKSAQTLTMSEVKEQLKSQPTLSSLATTETRLKQVVNFVNYKARTSSVQGSLPPSIAPVETRVSNWSVKSDDRPTHTSARRTKWDENDMKVLPRALKKHAYLPSTHIIREILASTAELRALLDQEGWLRMYNKVKNMYCAPKK